MIQKPRDYEHAQSYDSDFERLPVGGYVVEIKKMEESVTPRTNTPMVVITFDIADGPYKNYFAMQYKRDKAREITSGRAARWRGTYNVFPYTSDGMTNPSFKGFLVCVEKSNYGFQVSWPLNLEMFRGKKVGLLFREEEYEAYDGSIRTSVKACATRTCDCINNEEFNIPAKRLLNKNEASKPITRSTGSVVQNVYGSQEFTPVDGDSDDLPF